MRFSLWRRSDRGASPPRLEPDEASTAEPSAGVDVDLWVEAAQGDPNDEGHPLVEGDPGSLRDKLLSVLADEQASLVPPSAGGMTVEQWTALSNVERERFRRRQLRQIDPRFVPAATSSNRSRSTRVYR